MEHAPIRLLIVDDSLETCDILENFFTLTTQVRVCGISHDGEDALFRIAQQQPDVVLLDLVMPKLDGLAVLERLTHTQLPRRPRIIITSAVGQESFTSAALSLGADYYMIKPYDLQDLYNRVCTAAAIDAGKPAQPPARATSDGPELRISRALLELGLPAHMLGYRYCTAAVLLLLQSDGHQSIVKDVYTEVARSYETTPECVEGAIRKAIKKAWTREQDRISELAGETDTPSNGRFIINLAQRIRLGAGTGAN